MSKRSKVAVLRVTPQTVLADIHRLCELGGVREALDPKATTILKDNISWHYPFPAANTTPWQLEGTIQALRQSGYRDVTCVQNKTVVTDAFKGEDLNHYKPIFKKYDIPVLFNFKDEDMKWVHYKKMSAFPVDDPRLDARLRDVCARFFVALKGASFGRCDLRVDRNGVPFMLEINPNCGVYYLPEDAGSADLCLAHDPEGHIGFTRRLIRAALNRHRRRAEHRIRPGGSDLLTPAQSEAAKTL